MVCDFIYEDLALLFDLAYTMNYDRRSDLERTAAPSESSVSERLVRFAVTRRHRDQRIDR